MAERVCGKCGEVALQRVRFCRSCGAPLPADPSDAGGPPDAAGSGEGTMIAALPRPGSAPRSFAPPPPSAAEPPDETVVTGSGRGGAEAPEGAPPRAAGGTGEETMISGAAGFRFDTGAGGGATAPPPLPTSTAALPAREPPPPAAPGEKTVLAGGLRPRFASPEAPGTADMGPAAGNEDATVLGMRFPVGPPPQPTAAPLPLPPPPPPAPRPPSRFAPPPPEDEEEDFGVADEDDEVEPGETFEPPPPAGSDDATVFHRVSPVAATRPHDATPGPPPARRGEPAAAGEFVLEHWSPRQTRTEVRLDAAEVLVGREKGRLTFREDAYLSRVHARFFRDPEGALCVEDLGTLNGVFLRLKAPCILEHRDILQIGRHVLRFELLANEEEDPRTIEGDPTTRVMGVQGSPPRARFVKRQDEGFTGMPFFFGSRAYVLGRTSGTHRFTKDDRMSRRHAALNWREGQYVIEDLGSQNGTFLQIRGPRRLDLGDIVKMGDQYFRVVEGA